MLDSLQKKERLFLDCWITGLSIHFVIFIQPKKVFTLGGITDSIQEKQCWLADRLLLTSKDLAPRLADAKIHTDIMGSDHCPVELDLK